jgi:DNA invertase Pin-like site-specific DNA recombinase
MPFASRRWCDTTSPHGRLFLTVLAGPAKLEPSLIMERTQAGIAKARRLGKTFGRPTSLNVKQRGMIAERYAAEVGEATIWRALGGARNKDVARAA